LRKFKINVNLSSETGSRFISTYLPPLIYYLIDKMSSV
jgi:hypothetical protein